MGCGVGAFVGAVLVDAKSVGSEAEILVAGVGLDAVGTAAPDCTECVVSGAMICEGTGAVAAGCVLGVSVGTAVTGVGAGAGVGT